jgi:exosortase/archaeosortase family protein
MPTKFLKQVKRELRDKKAVKNVTRFVAIFVAIFFLFLFIIIPLSTPLWDFLGVFHASSAASMISAFGSFASASENVISVDVMGSETDFIVSQLCSGDVEIALLVALIIASFDVALFWRILGAVFGAILILLLNPLRIALTVMITQNQGMEAGDVAHSIIFRLFLFVLLVSYYFVWYHLCKGRKTPKRFRNILK